jgi:hypothetical protein
VKDRGSQDGSTAETVVGDYTSEFIQHSTSAAVADCPATFTASSRSPPQELIHLGNWCAV